MIQPPVGGESIPYQPAPLLSRRFLRALGRGALVVAACAPAVLAAGAVCALAMATAATEPRAVLRNYLYEAYQSSQAKDWKQAVLCLERVCTLEPDDLVFRFALVKALVAAGEDDRAEGLVAELAPLDHPGHAPAHVWRAVRLLQRPMVSLADLRDAETHLTRALEAAPENREAQRTLGSLYAQTGRPEQAEPLLSRSAAGHPEYLLLLSDVCKTLGKTSSAHLWAEAAAREFQKRATSGPQEEASRLKWAGAVVRLGHLTAAVQIIEEGLEKRGDSAALRRGLGDIYLARVELVEKDRPEDVAERLALLEVGLRQCPSHQGLLMKLAEVIRTRGADSRQARARLEGLLSEGQAAPTVHFLLGIDAYESGRIEEARLHFEQAYRLAPEMPFVANNLAWFLVEGPNPDSERALRLVDMAIARDPNELRFRSTRGRILVRMKRWKDALFELEAALPREAGVPEVHNDLATAYDALGMADLATLHRRRAAGPPKPVSKGSGAKR